VEDKDNLMAIAGLVILGLAVIICGSRMSPMAGNITSAVCGSLGTLLTSKIVKGGP